MPHYWLVDPASRTVETLAWDGTAWQPTGSLEGDLLRDPAPFPGLALDLAAVFAVP